MFFQISQSQREATIVCPYCHEDVLEEEPRVVLGGRPFHRNCWVRQIIDPTKNRNLGMTVRQEADAAVLAWETRHVA
jgi:hypothetical protein